MENNFQVVRRLFVDATEKKKQLDEYENLWKAMENNLECLDQRQRAWYDAQNAARSQFLTNFAVLQLVIERCTETNTPEDEMKLAFEHSSNIMTSYALLDFDKFYQYSMMIFF